MARLLDLHEFNSFGYYDEDGWGRPLSNQKLSRKYDVIHFSISMLLKTVMQYTFDHPLVHNDINRLTNS